MENKIFRVMKLALTTLFIFTTGLLASVRSQNMRIDFILNNAKTYNILEEIENRQTIFSFTTLKKWILNEESQLQPPTKL